MSEISIEELLPHSGKMLLLDEIIKWDEDWLEALVEIRDGSMFVEQGQVSALVVIEYMAQSVAALAGVRSKRKGEPVKIGLLLGTRNFDSNVPSIPVGCQLHLYVEQMFMEENGLGVFKCMAKAAGIEVSCHLNVYHADDIGALFA